MNPFGGKTVTNENLTILLDKMSFGEFFLQGISFLH